MSDDMGKKIKQITDILGQESMPDNVKGLLSMLAGSMDNPDTPTQNKSSEQPFSREEKGHKSDIEDNIDMVRKIKKIMDKVNTNNDPRVNLLNAIRPFLSISRQKKVANCIKLINMASMTKVMDEFNDKNF